MNKDEKILHLLGRIKGLEAEVKELKAALAATDNNLKSATQGCARLEADNEQLCLANNILTDRLKKRETSLRQISLMVDRTLYPPQD